MPKQPSGYELWRGPSRLDDSAPIVLLAKLRADNAKTGPMVTLYVLRQDMHPLDAVEAKKDDAICGDCSMRRSVSGSCYVDLDKGPGPVWRAWHAGTSYTMWPGSLEEFAKGLYVRMSAYGDIDALPRGVPQTLQSAAKGHTAYTEGWRSAPGSWRGWCMASVHSETEAAEARVLGWRTYRDRDPSEPLLEREVLCDYQSSKRRTRCIECLKCRGGQGESVVIDRH